MRAIAPRIAGLEEVSLAEDQLEYRPVVVARYAAHGGTVCVTRWQPSAAERQAIADGEDIYIAELIFSDFGFAPLHVSIGPDAHIPPDPPLTL